jgi:3'-phosphoadenosine 5'-phosphosulfate sulfotransferase (PAPS reductase)/FAD synthetase
MTTKVEQPVVKTESDKMWDQIKGLKIEMFSLPNQVVEQYCKRVKVEPSKLYITLNASSVLPALEVVLAGKYVLGSVGRYTTVEPVRSAYAV